MSEKKFLNRLATTSSPYLQQHASNPVDWHPWGKEAIEKAKRENKPILLSIGYTACHWCHVMAHESFADNETAELMNNLFINVKVDREERPDLDKVYQTAHYILTQQNGGWPLTVFLTPDLTPFFSGTYFPKESRYQLPAFKQVLQTIAMFYHQQSDEVKRQNQELLRILQNQGKTKINTPIDATPLQLALDLFEKTFDAIDGGFNGAPKFPQATKLALLLQEKSPMAFTTLEHMAKGGIYDQLGGGFYRYAIDHAWQIPHFEKMLYDNGLLLTIYVSAYQVSSNKLFAQIAEETAQWALTMQDTQGGFYSSMDADSEGEEGKFYTWDQASFQTALTEKEQQVASSYFGLNSAANFEHQWHLNVTQSQEALALDFNLPKEQINSLLLSAKKKLLLVRETRVHPFVDNKILTAWNSLMIKGLFNVGDILDENRFIASAERALTFIENHLWQNDELFACYAEGKVETKAYLDDYAYLADALLTSLQIKWDTKRLNLAVELVETLLTHFSDQTHGFFFTSDQHEKILYRPKTFMDEAIPAGNGVALQVLLILGHLLGEERYLIAAENILHAAWPSLLNYPTDHAAMLLGLRNFLQPPKIIIIRGEQNVIEQWRKESQSIHHLVFAIPTNLTDLPLPLSLRVADNFPCAYICEGQTCQPVIKSLDQLKAALAFDRPNGDAVITSSN